MSDSREALAHQRLAARLLALRTRQLENKLSQVSDDFVAPADIGCTEESCHVEDELSPVSDYCVTCDKCKTVAEKLSQVSDKFVTTSGVGSLQESSGVDDKFSLMSNNCMTLPDEMEESSEVEVLHQTEKSSELQSTVSKDTAREVASS